MITIPVWALFALVLFCCFVFALGVSCLITASRTDDWLEKHQPTDPCADCSVESAARKSAHSADDGCLAAERPQLATIRGERSSPQP